MDWWQRIPLHIDPVFVEIGPLQIRYYGLMWLISFLTVYLLTLYRLKRDALSYSPETVQDAFLWMLAGIVLGGRLGYVVFYDPVYYLHNPLEIFLPFRFANGVEFTGIAGMSYHGGLIGGILGLMLYCFRRKVEFWKFSDLIIPQAPLGYAFGRLGNFLNLELFGRPTTVPWGMYFPGDPLLQLRHPSQLYQAFFEGILLFVLLWSFRNTSFFRFKSLPLYLIGYGGIRFFIEFFREPDPHLGFIAGFLTMGQTLSIGMLSAGLAILLIISRRQRC